VGGSSVVTWFLKGRVVASGQITKRLLDSLEPREAEYFVWDGSLAGFGVRVQSTGARSYVVKYRAGSGRGAPTRRLTLGKVGTLTPDEARTLAKKTLGSVAHGADPAAQRAAEKRASTLAEVAEQFLTEHVEAKRSASSAKSYRDLLEVAVPDLGNRKAEKITTAEIQRLHSKHGHSPYQANRLLRVLSSLFGFAAKVHVVPVGFNPCRGIEYFPEEGRERYLTTQELAQIGEAIREAGREKYLQPLLDGPLGKLAAKDTTTQEAIEALFPKNPLPNSEREIGTTVSALAKRNPDAASDLVRAHAESAFNNAARDLQTGANQAGGAKFRTLVAGNAQQRLNLREAVEALPNGAARWDGFNKLLDTLEAGGDR
jgi:hypothetical protein